MSEYLFENVLDGDPSRERVVRPMSVVVFWPDAHSDPSPIGFIADEIVDRVGIFEVAGYSIPMKILKEQR